MAKKLMKLIALFVIISLTGCWDKKELDEIAILSGVGIDQTEDEKLSLTMQVVLHRDMKIQAQSGLRGEDRPTQNIIVEGDSLIDANRNFSLQSGRKGFWSHVGTFVIGEELAKAGIGDIIDVLERDHEIRRRTYLLVTRSKARDIMDANVINLEAIQSYNFNDMVETYRTNAKTISIDLQKYITMMSEKNASAFMTGINFINDPEKTTKCNALELRDTGIFKNHKLIGWFDVMQTRGLLWTRGEVEECIVKVEYPYAESCVFIEIYRAGSKIKPVIEDNKIKIVVELSAQGKVAQSNPKTDLTKAETIEKLNEASAKTIKEEALKAIKKGQELRADVFGFGDSVYRKYPETWESIKDNWDDVFRTITIEVNTKVTLKRTGLITNCLKD